MHTLLIISWITVFVLIGAGWVLRRRYQKILRAHERDLKRLTSTQTMLRRISQAVESTSDAVGIGDMNGNSVYHNRAHLEMFGYTVQEINALPETGTLFADKAVAKEIFDKISAGESWAGETTAVAKDGRQIPVAVRTDVIRDHTGKAVGIFGVFSDITERQVAQQQLRSERARLRVTLESIGDGVITTDANGEIVLMNTVAERLTGWSRADAASRPLEEVLPLLDISTRQAITSPALRMLRAGTGDPFGHDYVLVSRDGTERTIAESTSFIRGNDHGVAGLVQVLRDVTNERKHAAEHARTQRLESLGLLAGGIAHDFNNLLTTMICNLHLARHTPGVPEASATRMDDLEQVIWRARDLTENLKTFAKGDVPKKKPMAMGKLTREAATDALLGKNVTVKYDIAEDLCQVEADASQIEQVISNIVLNSAQAMTAGGHVEIVARNNVIAGDDGANTGLSWVDISISDNGPGIKPELLPKIFDPFFTTKEQGTGLGLATAHSIMRAHRGQMRVESTLGKGTTFHLSLPAHVPVEHISLAKELGLRAVK
ncbi:PAS domain S-box protein [Oleiharenicola lentus]|uniref:PAS domain S-box protein n=1 Tax=Oleiharenicola lentus TaxID=2508720 RepID=UPI003F6663D7